MIQSACAQQDMIVLLLLACVCSLYVAEVGANTNQIRGDVTTTFSSVQVTAAPLIQQHLEILSEIRQVSLREFVLEKVLSSIGCIVGAYLLFHYNPRYSLAAFYTLGLLAHTCAWFALFHDERWERLMVSYASGALSGMLAFTPYILTSPRMFAEGSDQRELENLLDEIESQSETNSSFRHLYSASPSRRSSNMTQILKVRELDEHKRIIEMLKAASMGGCAGVVIGYEIHTIFTFVFFPIPVLGPLLGHGLLLGFIGVLVHAILAYRSHKIHRPVLQNLMNLVSVKWVGAYLLSKSIGVLGDWYPDEVNPSLGERSTMYYLLFVGGVVAPIIVTTFQHGYCCSVLLCQQLCCTCLPDSCTKCCPLFNDSTTEQADGDSHRFTKHTTNVDCETEDTDVSFNHYHVFKRKNSDPSENREGNDSTESYVETQPDNDDIPDWRMLKARIVNEVQDVSFMENNNENSSVVDLSDHYKQQWKKRTSLTRFTIHGTVPPNRSKAKFNFKQSLEQNQHPVECNVDFHESEEVKLETEQMKLPSDRETQALEQESSKRRFHQTSHNVCRIVNNSSPTTNATSRASYSDDATTKSCFRTAKADFHSHTLNDEQKDSEMLISSVTNHCAQNTPRAHTEEAQFSQKQMNDPQPESNELPKPPVSGHPNSNSAGLKPMQKLPNQSNIITLYVTDDEQDNSSDDSNTQAQQSMAVEPTRKDGGIITIYVSDDSDDEDSAQESSLADEESSLSDQQIATNDVSVTAQLSKYDI